MNIILITIDGARVDLIRQFPGFDNFFNQGTYFPMMITYAPYTIASLHAIFTGIYGDENGVDNYYGCKNFKRNLCETLTQYMKDAGYYTRGDTFNRIFVPEEGFDRLTIYNEYEEDLVKRHAKILREMKNTGKFFLWLHYSKIHTSLVKDVIKRYDDFSEEYFSDKEKNLIRYKTYIKKASDYFTRIIEECKSMGLREDTLIIVFSDHGVSTGERVGEKVYGVYCYDYAIRTFSFFYKPGIFPVMEIKQQIRNVDIMPTILDVLGIELDSNYRRLDGKSLLPLIHGQENEGRVAYSETGGLGGPFPSPKKPNVKCIRTQEWKLIYNTTTKERELYNLEKDPEELDNLAGKGPKGESYLWSMMEEHLKKAHMRDLKDVVDSIEV